MAMTSNIILLLVIVAIILIGIFVALCFLERALARKSAWWPGPVSYTHLRKWSVLCARNPDCGQTRWLHLL